MQGPAEYATPFLEPQGPEHPADPSSGSPFSQAWQLTSRRTFVQDHNNIMILDRSIVDYL